MIKLYELTDDADIQRFNESVGKTGITVGKNLFGNPIIYVDYTLLNKTGSNKSSLKKQITSKQKETVLQLHSSGANYRKISSMTGVSLGSISKIIKTH